MNELNQPKSLKPIIESKGHCIYISPSDDAMDAYAQAVCDALEQKFGNPNSESQTEFVRGFSNFIKVVNRIQVKHLNKGVLYEESETQPKNRT